MEGPGHSMACLAEGSHLVRHLMVSQGRGAGQESPVVLSEASHTALLGEGKLSLPVPI